MNYLVAVNRKFGDNPSGSARVAWDIACLARDGGHNVVMLCQTPKLAAAKSEKSFEDGITIIRFGLGSGHFFQRRRHRQAVNAALCNHLGGFRPDTVHIHSLFIGDAVIAALGHHQNYVATIHSPVVPETRLNWEAQGWRGKAKIALGGLEWLRRVQNQVLDRCQRVHVLSQYTQRELEQYVPKLPPISVIPHWRLPDLVRRETKAQARAELNWPASEPVLFSLRRMVPRMGHETAIRAIAPLLQKYQARMVLAGDGPLRNTLQSLSAKLPGGNRIEFPGRISDEHMRLMYSGADLFVLPTTALECFGLIILEAYSYGCPVLATNVGAIPESVGPLMPEFLIEPDDIHQLRERTQGFLSGQLVAPAESTILKYLETHYDLAIVGPKLMRFLEPV
jgi:glycosyltransferase involved in cell wall biosynthesis